MPLVRTGALTLCLLVALLPLRPPPATAAPADVRYERPIDGQTVRDFVAPSTPYGSGHRGADLLAPPGSRVRTAAPGTVTFAGPVAGDVWVTVLHADGIRTSYGPLRDVVVRSGDVVAAGGTLGLSTGPPHGGTLSALHWSARRGDTYIDPLALVDASVRPWTASLIGPGEWWATDRPPLAGYAYWDGDHRFGLVPPSDVATAAGWITPPNVNHIIGIAGLGSRTGEPPLDLTHLGYHPDDVSQLSYRADGGYGPEDTWVEVDAAARRLRVELRRRWEEEPGRAVDLVGHSLGGVVALHYLMTYHDPLDPTLPPIGHVATIASPLEGADLARVLVDLRRGARGRLVTDTVSRLVPGYDAGAPVVTDLAVGSELLRGLDDAWAEALAEPYAGPLATGTRVLTLGADADLVVPEHRSDLPGAAHVVLPGTHESVRRTEAARWVLRSFLTGAPVPGEAGGVGHWLSYGVGWSERAVGRALR